MFDLGASELLLIVIVAVIVIGPKDLPLAMRTAGRWIGKLRRISGHFRAGLDAMVRESELEEFEKQWQERNAAIMKETGLSGEMQADQMQELAASGAESAAAKAPDTQGRTEPQLPLPPP